MMLKILQKLKTLLTPKPPIWHIKTLVGDLSWEDVDIIRQFEGHSLTAYKCPAGIWTISYGISANMDITVREGLVITEEQSREMFRRRLQQTSIALEYSLKNHKLTKNQHIALLSFVWNLGIGAFNGSTIRTMILNNDPMVAQQFDRWVKANGVILRGLVRRRQAEKELFLKK